MSCLSHMKATVDAKEFSLALDKVSKVLHKSAIPILENVLVRFSGGRCTLVGSDLNSWLTTSLPAQGNDFAFVFHRTADVAKVCRRFDGELSLELSELYDGKTKWLRLYMGCGRREGELGAFYSKDYAALPEVKPEYFFTANAAGLLERINRVKYATRKPDKESDLFRTCVQFSGSRIFCLDGIRAAWDADEALTISVPFMAPTAPMEYLKLFGKQDVSVGLGERYMDITDGITHLKFRHAGTVPFNLDSAIPREFHEEFYVYPDDFLKELTYLKEFMPATHQPRVRFCGGRLFTQSGDCQCRAEIQMEGTSEMEIAFDLHHMIDALRQFKGTGRVRMRLVSPVFPIVLDAEGRNDCAMVLPVRLPAMAA